MYKSYSLELGGRTLTVDIGRVCAQANGAALLKYGETTVLSTATASDKPRDGIDFFPLSVEYEEKMYSVGKIPGGFNKREGKASENAVLTSRVIDRPMRPLFPKDYRNDTSIDVLVLAVDPDVLPEVPASIGASIALNISDIPFDVLVGTSKVGLVDGELVLNPDLKQREKSKLDLTVSATPEKVCMIEAGAAGVVGKTALGVLNTIPGINIAAEVLNAIVAGTIVAALGEGCIYVFEQIYTGAKSANDIEWVKKSMESEAVKRVMSRLQPIITELQARSATHKLTTKEIVAIILKNIK